MKVLSAGQIPNLYISKSLKEAFQLWKTTDSMKMKHESSRTVIKKRLRYLGSLSIITELVAAKSI